MCYEIGVPIAFEKAAIFFYTRNPQNEHLWFTLLLVNLTASRHHVINGSYFNIVARTAVANYIDSDALRV